MRIEKRLNIWIIVRGRDRGESVFCFLVDHNKSSWSLTKPWTCQGFSTIEEAQETLRELRRRNNLRRKSNRVV